MYQIPRMDSIEYIFLVRSALLLKRSELSAQLLDPDETKPEFLQKQILRVDAMLNSMAV